MQVHHASGFTDVGAHINSLHKSESKLTRFLRKVFMEAIFSLKYPRRALTTHPWTKYVVLALECFPFLDSIKFRYHLKRKSISQITLDFYVQNS